MSPVDSVTSRKTSKTGSSQKISFWNLARVPRLGGERQSSGIGDMLDQQREFGQFINQNFSLKILIEAIIAMDFSRIYGFKRTDLISMWPESWEPRFS